MSPAPDPSRKLPYNRLLIGFDHHMECRSVLDFAVQVAVAAEVELAGVFVEDQELLDSAQLPFSTEFLHASGQTRNLDRKSIESELRAVAGTLHNALRNLAEHAHRQYSFRTVRGRLLRDLISQAGAGDLILLRMAGFAWRSASPGIGRIAGKVVVLVSKPGENGNLTSLAQEIARALKQPLTILSADDWQQSLSILKAGLIIAPSSIFGEDLRGADIERFAGAVRCPVLIVPRPFPEHT